MGEGGTAKVAVGLAAGLGLAGVRLLDDCGRVGAKAARLGDEVVDARRLGSALDEPATAMRWGPPPPPHGSNAAAALGKVDEMAPSASHVGESITEALADGGVEVAMQLAQLDVGDAAPEPPQRLVSPKLLDIRHDDAAWHKLIGGFGVRLTPTVIVANARDGQQLQVGDRWRDVDDLANQCAQLGTMCIFVGCRAGDAGCAEATRDAQPRRLARMGLPGYVQQFTETRFSTGTPPLFVAAMANHTLMTLAPAPDDAG